MGAGASASIAAADVPKEVPDDDVKKYFAVKTVETKPIAGQ